MSDNSTSWSGGPLVDGRLARAIAAGSAARRDDQGKTDWSSVPMDAMELVAEVFHWARTERANPYPMWNYRKGMPKHTSYNCMFRHLMDWWTGSKRTGYVPMDKDHESGKHPLAHLIASALIELSAEIRGIEREDLRYFGEEKEKHGER